MREIERVKAEQASREPSTPFRAQEMYFRNRVSQPDVSTAFSAVTATFDIEQCTCVFRDRTVRKRKLQKAVDAECITFDELPGLVLLPSFLSPASQRALVKTCLKEGPRRPNTTSLDPHYHLPQDGIWQYYQSDSKNPVKKKLREPEKVLKRTTVDLNPISNENFRSERTEDRQRDLTVMENLSNEHGSDQVVHVEQVLDKLRWSSIGLPYHWGTKTYLQETADAPRIPDLIHSLCTDIVKMIPWLDLLPNEPSSTNWNSAYRPEGGIINYYGTRDTLTAHIDQSEADTTSPLVSISLGLDAIFLIGGETRQTEPTPILLKSGDVLLMSGPSRRVFHGIPRVLETGGVLEDQANDEEWSQGGFQAYMQRKRINVNVRQIWPSN